METAGSSEMLVGIFQTARVHSGNFLDYIREVLISNLGRGIYLSEDLRSFPQSPQANSEAVPRIGHNLSLIKILSYSLLTSHHTIPHYTPWATDTVVKKTRKKEQNT
jgi:hypothetical protein